MRKSQTLAACVGLVVVIVAAADVIAQRPPLSDEQVQRAIDAGLRSKDDDPPVISKGGAGGFRITLTTSLGGIQLIAAGRARKYESMTAKEIGVDARAQVLTVLVRPATPSKFTTSDLAYASSVSRVVLMSKDGRVLQPMLTTPRPETLSNALGAKLTYTGLSAVFPMDAVDGLWSDGDSFTVVVVPENGAVKEGRFEIKRKDFDKLP